MPYNLKSLANLTRAGKGRPKKERVKKLFSLSPESVAWLEKQPNQSEAVDRLIQKMITYIVISKPNNDGQVTQTPQTSNMIEGWIVASDRETAKAEAIPYLETDWIEAYPFVRLDEEAQMDATQRGNIRQRWDGLTYAEKFLE